MYGRRPAIKRSDARALAQTTLAATGLFAKIWRSEPEAYGGYNPVAMIHSKSLAILQDARDDFTAPAEIFVTIAMRRNRDMSEAEKDAVEDALDALSRAAMRALWDAFYDAAASLTIGPSETGYPNRVFDSGTYRIERFAVRFDDDQED